MAAEFWSILEDIRFLEQQEYSIVTFFPPQHIYFELQI